MTVAVEAQAAADVLRTGVQGLDLVLGGGFRRGTSILLRGTPGSGKSVLGMQIIMNGILQDNEPGLILSFEQFPEQLERDAASFGWNLREMAAARKLRVIFARRDDLFSSFAEKESNAITQITEGVIEIGAKRLLVDPTNLFWQLPMSAEEQRRLFSEFVLKLKGLGLTVILTSDLLGESESSAHEEFTVDTVVRLSHSLAAHLGGRRERTIEIVKARGQGFVEGGHSFRIDSGGVRVAPFVPLTRTDNQEVCVEGSRRSTGSADLDELMNGGFQCGTVTMLAGMSGTGKTILAAHFVAAALAKGDAAVYVSLNERPNQLIRNMDRRGLGFGAAAGAGRLHVVHASGGGLDLAAFYHDTRRLVQETRPACFVIDGLRDFLASAAGGREREHYLALFNDLLFQNGVTAVYTWRVEDVAGLSSVASIPHTSMADNIIYLGLVELESKLRKVIAIFKTRGELIDNSLRELVVTTQDVKVSNLFIGISGILQGSASGRLSEAGREILEPMVHIRDFVNSAEVTTVEQARYVVDNIRQEFNVLAAKIAEHFGARPAQ